MNRFVALKCSRGFYNWKANGLQHNIDEAVVIPSLAHLPTLIDVCNRALHFRYLNKIVCFEIVLVEKSEVSVMKTVYKEIE